MLIWPDHPAFTVSLDQLKGVGPKTRAALEAEGFLSGADLLALSPRFYQDRRRPLLIADLQDDQEALLEVTSLGAKARWSPRTRRRFADCQVEDERGERLTLCWFNFPGYLLKSLPKGRRLRVFGRVRFGRRGWEMAHPDLEFLDDEPLEPDFSPGLRPVYPPLGPLSATLVKKLIDQLLPRLEDCPPFLPQTFLEKHALSDPVEALKILHSPPGDFSGAVPRPSQCRAWRQLALFELSFWRLMMLQARAGAAAGKPRSGLAKGRKAVEGFLRLLPFELSPEQARVSDELLSDLSGPRPMSRLLQGEVGGGKTAVAGTALFFALGRGGQGALMAPTELLARQHYDFLKGPAEALGFQAVLLTGALPEKEKKAARAALAEGRAQLAVGSQALLSPATVFRNLSLAVIDEQHRFGVRQRLALRRKSRGVDILAMSATPIPRSLTLMLYGDLDSSSLRGLLPGRRPAETSLFQPDQRREAYARFLELAGLGGQGFLVTPRIEAAAEEEDNPLPPLNVIAQDLRKLAGPLSVAELHGQMEPADRAEVMESFRLGRTNILVATSIIEVGVDVPAAGVILIEGAERFGLAQLHQLRGRVGRGGQAGFCLLLPSKSNPAGEKRLQTLVREHDGQALAEMDLEMRGPGEQLGLRQSGWPAMSYARLPQDLPLLTQAHQLARELWELREEDGGTAFWSRFQAVSPADSPALAGELD